MGEGVICRGKGVLRKKVVYGIGRVNCGSQKGPRNVGGKKKGGKVNEERETLRRAQEKRGN